MRDVLQWARRHPATTGITVIITTLILIGQLVVWIPIWVTDRARVGIVDDYLSALQDGDAHAAIDIADGGTADRSYRSNIGPSGDQPQETFLTDNALRTDWEYGDLTLGESEYDPLDEVVSTTVHATLFYDGSSYNAKFEVNENHDDLWLAQPYAIVDLKELNANPVTIDAVTTTVRDETQSTYMFFPGPHQILSQSQLYEVPNDDSTPLWTPGEGNKKLPTATLTAKAQQAAAEAFGTYLAECAETFSDASSSCQFTEYTTVVVNAQGTEIHSDIEILDWRIDSYPQMKFVNDMASLLPDGSSSDKSSLDSFDPMVSGITIEPGYLIIEGASDTSAPDSFTAECVIEPSIKVRAAEPLEFKFDTDETDPQHHTRKTLCVVDR
ncbi:MAG TPA: hypothetical protein H9902_10920 [Candidatus Stackebrandtia faecavium]|nr:hypothetical protein [Candidatus Stackebrandtia faecavium]